MPSRIAADSVQLARRTLLLAMVLSPRVSIADQDASHGGVAPPPSPPSMPASEPPAPRSGSPEKAIASNSIPRWAVGLNLLEPVVCFAGTTVASNSMALVVAPVPVDLHARLSDAFGIKGTLLYRYFKDRNAMRAHEFAIAVGPRLSLTGKGLEGLHLAVTGGVGYVSGHGYEGKFKNVDLVLRSELAYAKLYANGVYMVIGAGLFSMFPIYEHPDPIYWTTAMKFFHYYQPTINLTIGYAL
jgi:hypothetical protein